MKCGLVGHPLGHSYSPLLHKEFGEYEYSLFDLPENEVADFLKAREFDGINVTVPYKEKVLPYLDKIDASVDKIGSCNTILNRNEKLIGFNTDYYGLNTIVNELFESLRGKTVAILGTGGTSKTAQAVIKDLEAGKLHVVSRRPGEGVLTYDQLYETAKEIDVILNATPVGMWPNFNAKPVDLNRFCNLKGVIDVVYNPLKSDLVLEAERLGIPAIGGLKMLVAQAHKASELFQGKSLDLELIEKAYNKLLWQKRNIVLIGMPSSGKSKLGRMLSEKLNKKYIDTDDIFVQRMNMPISDYMSMFGESNFRRIEKEIVASLVGEEGVVISTGGGVILNQENVINLKRNGRVYFLDRPLEQLKPSKSRPLSSDLQAIKKLYDLRYPIYLKSMDVRVEGGKGIEYEIKTIMEDLGL